MLRVPHSQIVRRTNPAKPSASHRMPRRSKNVEPDAGENVPQNVGLKLNNSGTEIHARNRMIFRCRLYPTFTSSLWSKVTLLIRSNPFGSKRNAQFVATTSQRSTPEDLPQLG